MIERDETAAARRTGDAWLAARALGIGRDLGRRWRERHGTIAAAMRDAGVRWERRTSGGLVAGLCVVSEYHDAQSLIVVYDDALASLARRMAERGLAPDFAGCDLGELALAHETFHRIHRRRMRREIDAALLRNRRAEEVAAHAFAAAFHGLSRSGLLLEL